MTIGPLFSLPAEEVGHCSEVHCRPQWSSIRWWLGQITDPDRRHKQLDNAQITFGGNPLVWYPTPSEETLHWPTGFFAC